MAYEALAAAFVEGDVLYGLNDHRAVALQAIVASGVPQDAVSSRGCLCRPTTRKNVLIQNHLTNAVISINDRLPTYSSNRQIGRTLADAERGTAFKQFLGSHGKFNVPAQIEAGKLNPNSTKTQAKQWSYTSKAGLEFQVRSAAQRSVHFVVSGLIWNQVAGKTELVMGHELSVTGSEIRWLYRHRDKPEVADRVRFWETDREVPQAEVWNRLEAGHYEPKERIREWGDANLIRAALNVMWG